MFPSIQEIVGLPVAQQAKYADHICAGGAKNLGFCQGQLAGLTSNTKYDDWNATLIGNAAYMSLYGCEETRSSYKDVLDRAKEHYKERNRTSTGQGSAEIHGQECSLM
jgi:hypothetical protein